MSAHLPRRGAAAGEDHGWVRPEVRRRHSGNESPIQSVARAAKMLGLFSVDKPELSLTDLTQQMGLSKGTAHRYVTSLRRTGLLRSAHGTYTLGPRIVELSAAALAGLSVIKVAGPYLERLVSETSRTAVLSVWDGEAPVVVSVNDNTGGLVRISITTGQRLPLDSAQGKVFRAYLYFPDTASERARLAIDGVALKLDVVEGIAALAAPVFQADEIVATMALVGTTAAIPGEDHSRLAGALRDAAGSLSAELGFSMPTSGSTHGPSPKPKHRV